MANVMDLPSFGAAEGGRAGCLERLIGINVVFGKGVGSSTLCRLWHVFHFLEPIVGSVTACDGSQKVWQPFLA